MPLSKQSFWVFTHPPLWMVVVDMTVSTSGCAETTPSQVVSDACRCVMMTHRGRRR